MYNAFNTISQATILDSGWADFPSLGKWIEFSRCHAGPPLTGSCSILSTNGVQQGDPLGPFLFSVRSNRIIAVETEIPHNFAAVVTWTTASSPASSPTWGYFFKELATQFEGISLVLSKLKMQSLHQFTKDDCVQLASLSRCRAKSKAWRSSAPL